MADEASPTLKNLTPIADQTPASVDATIDSSGLDVIASSCNNNVVKTSDGEKEKSLEYAEELMEKGSKANKENNYTESTDCFSRALEIRIAFVAIARREAHGLQLQQQKIRNNNNKRFLDENRVEGSGSIKRTDRQVTSSSNTPSKKGRYSFSGQTFTHDAEADHPIYLPLSHPAVAKPGLT